MSAKAPLVVMITAQQLARLESLCEVSAFSPDYQIGAMIDLDYEEWQDTQAPDGPSRSTRFGRFVAQDGGAS